TTPPVCSLVPVAAQPGEDLPGVLAGREDRVEDVLDAAVADDQGVAPAEAPPARLEGRQADGLGEPDAGGGEHGVGQVQAVGDALQVGGFLDGQAVHAGRAGGEEVGVVVAEAAGLGRAAARPGDGVPAVGQVDVRGADEREEVEHVASAQGVRPDGVAGACGQFDLGHGQAGQVAGRAVVLGHGQGGVVGHGDRLLVVVGEAPPGRLSQAGGEGVSSFGECADPGGQLVDGGAVAGQ